MKARLKIFLHATFVIFSALLLSCTPSTYQDKQSDSRIHHLVILHTNDTHGHPVRFFQYPTPDVGGLSARANAIKMIREKNRDVLLLDAGDVNKERPVELLREDS